MDKANTDLQSLHRLPQELIEDEILTRLPVKSLLVFRCVSKSWLSLIDSKLFIKNHLQNYTNTYTCDNYKVMIQCGKHGLNHCSMHSYTYDPYLNLSPIDDPKNSHLMSGIILGCCNGILCIYHRSGFFLWNPATRISMKFCKVDFRNGNLKISKWAFGWEEKSNAYKVFVGLSDDADIEKTCQVYSSKTNSWKTVEFGSVPLYANGRLVSGKIHWLTRRGRRIYIESFDLATEVFGMMEQPYKPAAEEEEKPLYLEKDGDCLMVFHPIINDEKKTYRVWIMEEYGEQESWLEVMTEPDSKSSGCCKPFYYVESLVSPLFENN